MVPAKEDRFIVLAFDVISIILIILLLLVVLTAAFSRQVQRRASWFGFMLPVIFYQTSFLLLLGAQNHSQPPFPLCVVQSVLIYALPVYCAISFACFVLDFYLLLKEIFYGVQTSKEISRSLLTIPLATFFAIFTIDLALILNNQAIRSGLRPDVSGLYCRSDNNIPAVIAVGTGVPGLCMWFFVYFKTAMLLKRQKSVVATYEESLRSRILSVFIRTTLMTFATCIGVGLSIRAAVVPPLEEQPYNISQYLAFSLTILLLFGTQSEFFKCWMCRRPSKRPQSASTRTGVTSL